jgi:hypothetical protein
VKPNGRYLAFLEDSRGTIQAADREIAVRAMRIKSRGVKDAIDCAYLEKFNLQLHFSMQATLAARNPEIPTTTKCEEPISRYGYGSVVASGVRWPRGCTISLSF